ncbi:MAG: helix-turn-helix domain-containing protein [Ruminiclostridium sp.]
MSIGKRIKKVRKNLGFTQDNLASRANISRSYLADVENGRYNPSFNTLERIAGALEVSVDRLTGESASSIIEARLDEIGMTLSELAEKSKVPLTFLENLDSIVPDLEGDGGEQCYSYMSSIAWVLGIPGSKLRLAFARQEIPASKYDNIPKSSAAEAFSEPYLDNKTDNSTQIKTIAAHFKNKTISEEKLKSIEKFIKFTLKEDE